jgi:hypothetical protein
MCHSRRVQAIFFTYALILTDFYGVDSADIGFFLIPFALGNFLGSVTIGTVIPGCLLSLLFFKTAPDRQQHSKGRLFDTVGRKPMIFITYMVSAILLVPSPVLRSVICA